MVTMKELFINKEQWDEIYDIARTNGYAVHRLVIEISSANPYASEPEFLEAAREWSKKRAQKDGNV